MSTHPNNQIPKSTNGSRNRQGSALPANQRHRRGHVARLPKQLRDQVNNMIRDGIQYRVILEKLRPTAGGLLDSMTELHLSRWRARGGYQEWLDQQEWRESMRAKQEDNLDLLNGLETSKLHEVSLQLAAMRIFELLQRLEPSALSSTLDELPRSYLRLLTALPRITREALRYQKYRDACIQARSELKPLRDPKRKLTDDERLAIVRHVDEILGLAAPSRDPDPPGPKLP